MLGRQAAKRGVVVLFAACLLASAPARARDLAQEEPAKKDSWSHLLGGKQAIEAAADAERTALQNASAQQDGCFAPGVQGEFCNGSGQYFGTETVSNVQQCMFRCSKDTHPFIGSKCWGFEYSLLSGVCFYYDYSEVQRCDIGGNGQYSTYRLTAGYC